jgi:serine/threonine protein kinase
MLSKVLSSIYKVTEVLYEDKDYLLARVELEGKKLLAEIVPADDTIPLQEKPLKVPAVDGIIRMLREQKLPHGEIVRLFETKGRKLLKNRMGSGSMDKGTAFTIVRRLIPILRNSHHHGKVFGYLGPESILIDNSDRPFILASCRKVPNLHFSAPEAVGIVPSDPRSDVFALGTLLFRLLSGTDDREEQISKWNSMRKDIKELIEQMVAEEPENRTPNMMILEKNLSVYKTEPPDYRTETSKRIRLVNPSLKSAKKKKSMIFIYLAIIAVILVTLIIFIPSEPETGNEDQQLPAQFVSPSESLHINEEDLEENLQNIDTLVLDTAIQEGIITPPGETVLWISNFSGRNGEATDFRNGPARDFSQVYPSTGAGIRENSLLLCRRSDLFSPLEQQPVWLNAQSILENDSIFEINPVDITILIGTDLSHAGINFGLFQQPVQPSETLYVEVVNWGLQYSLEGMGAATWLSSKMENKSLILDGREFLVRISDIRDGDRLPNDEVGLPPLLDRSLFLYREDVNELTEAEEKIRKAIQSIPDIVEGPPLSLPVPDIWVILGSN